MRVECLKPSQIDDALWGALVGLRDRDVRYDNPMHEPEFIRILGRLRSDVRILIGFENDKPIVYFPIQKHAGKWARPAAGPFSDWHSPIGDSTRFAELLDQAGISGVTVHGFMPHDLKDCPATLSRQNSHVTLILGDYSEYHDNQKKMFAKYFKKTRRQRRNLESNVGPLEFCYDDRSEDAFEWLINIKREQYSRTNRHDVLAADWASEFVRQVHELKCPRFRTVMCTLRINGELIAAEMNMQSDVVLHGWLTGFDRKHAVHSPGLVLVEMMLEAMVERGIRVYDAGPGLAHYKKYYSNYSYPVDDGVLMARASLHPVRMLGGAWRRAESLPLGLVSRTMQKIRRRMDQVLQAELTFFDRLRGLLSAIRAFGE